MPPKSRGTITKFYHDTFQIKIDQSDLINSKLQYVVKGDVARGRRVMFVIAVNPDGKFYADEVEVLTLNTRAEKRVNPQPIHSTIKSSGRDNPDKKPPVFSTYILSGSLNDISS
jgi:hypothetical protein